MPSGLIALLDDVATIAKLAASSLDDVAAAAGKASTKAAGVVIDDTAVTPRYVVGLSPERELPIIGKIAAGSLKNKLLILLPAALLLTAFAPFLIVPLLMLGGSYLAFEATEKIAEIVLHDHGHEEQLVDAMADPADLEALQVKGAIRTDFILSAEIMAIALASLDHLSLATTAFALVAVALAITAGVYGVVALIVKLDDIGLHLAERSSPVARRIGDGLVHVVPIMLSGFVGHRHRGDAVGRRRDPAPRPRGAAFARSRAACPPRLVRARRRGDRCDRSGRRVVALRARGQPSRA